MPPEFSFFYYVLLEMWKLPRNPSVLLCFVSPHLLLEGSCLNILRGVVRISFPVNQGFFTRVCDLGRGLGGPLNP